MRHRKNGLKIGRTSSHRNAMFRNMVTSLLKYDKIRTTDTKAKELRKWADHLITLAKRGDLHARRQALAIVREKNVVHKLFEDAADRFGNIAGGYTRIIKLGRRPGDAATMSLIELVSDSVKKPAGKKGAEKPETPTEKEPEVTTAADSDTEKDSAESPAAAEAAAQSDTAEDTADTAIPTNENSESQADKNKSE